MTWIDKSFEEIDELFTTLYYMSVKENPIACRGQSDSRWPLRCSLDRLLEPNADYKERLAQESVILEKFRVLAIEYFGQIESERLKQSLSNNKISALTVPQHYRAPTRLLDWTHSPWIALYFAAIEHHERDGALWWFRQKPFEDEVHRRWDEVYHMKRYPERNNEVNPNDTAFASDGPEWITKLHCIIPFHRIEVQQAFFTVAGRLGLDHGEHIADLRLADDQYGRIIVPGRWKQDILNILRVMNIHSKSLDYPGADLVGSALSRELREANRRVGVDQSGILPA
jgi:hypothetical protein